MSPLSIFANLRMRRNAHQHHAHHRQSMKPVHYYVESHSWLFRHGSYLCVYGS